MYITQLTKDISRLIITTLNDQSGDLPSAKDIRQLLTFWGLVDAAPMVSYSTSLMGGSETDYIKLGSIHFALIQNFDIQPDAFNRYLFVVPLYASIEGRVHFFGADTIPEQAVSSAREQLNNLN